MVTVTDPVKKLQKFSVFQVTLVGLAGQHPKDSPNHQDVAEDRKNQLDDIIGNKGRNQAKEKADTQQRQIQFVAAVAAHHKAAKACTDFSE